MRKQNNGLRPFRVFSSSGENLKAFTESSGIVCIRANTQMPSISVFREKPDYVGMYAFRAIYLIRF